MRIAQSTFNPAFGKQAVMTCVVKDKATGTPHNATLYKLDPKNEQDQRDVYFSKQAFCMSKDFEDGKTNPISCREFYMLQNDKTKEVISCAQTLHRCRRPKFTHPGLYTMIEEANSNYKYKNGEEPLYAYIAKRAGERYDSKLKEQQFLGNTKRRILHTSKKIFKPY